jgi:hypothetical protein
LSENVQKWKDRGRPGQIIQRKIILKDVENGYLIKRPGHILNQEIKNQEIKNHFVLSVINQDSIKILNQDIES